MLGDRKRLVHVGLLISVMEVASSACSVAVCDAAARGTDDRDGLVAAQHAKPVRRQRRGEGSAASQRAPPRSKGMKAEDSPGRSAAGASREGGDSTTKITHVESRPRAG